MKWNPATRTLVMDRHNAEHCKFNWDFLEGEVFLNGIDDPAAKSPRKIIIMDE